MNKYENYKKVEIPWVRKIPTHWRIERNKNIFIKTKSVVGIQNKTTDLLSLTIKGIKVKSKGQIGGKQPSSYEGYQFVNKGNLVLCLFDLDCSAVFSDVSQYNGMISPAYDVFKVEKQIPQYYKYLFSYLFQDRVYKIYSKSVRYTINEENFNTLLTLVPPIEEQEHIANYLDWKIGEIDKVIYNENKKVRELEEIFNKYIDSKFSVGNSKNKGLRLKYIVKTVTEKTKENSRYIGLEHIISKKGILKVPYEELPVNDEGIKIEKGTVIFGKLRPYLGKAVIVEDNLICSSEFLCLKPIKVTSKYLKYLMLSEKFIDLVNNSTYGAKMPRANSEFILNLRVLIPDMNEQKLITNEIELFEEKIENYIYISKQKIEELKKLKHSLISEVVTGQLDVRNVKIPERE